MPPPASSSPTKQGNGGQAAVTESLRETTSYRIEVVAEALHKNALSIPCADTTKFRELSIGLARLIDYAVTIDLKPLYCPRLPRVFKQVCEHRISSPLIGAIMVLMISVKSVCNIGWFSVPESKELLCLVDEVSKNFCTPAAAGPDQTSTPSPAVSQIMSRFYPWLKLGHIIASLEVKPGFGAYLVDFLYPNGIRHNQDERIRLLVAAIDNTDTSSCITSPSEVSFLVNGTGVDRRTTAFVDPGPQLPTVIEPLLRSGANLLQAVGRFDGRYVILVACFSFVPVNGTPFPPDYVQPANPVVDTDADIIEGPSQIKLTCPISFKRIALPAKGYMCKHHQCFDFDNYMKINLRRPSWKCPLCNQSVCHVDIRIDRRMCKILEEAEENVVDVIISEDGSWKAASGGSSHNIETDGRKSASPQDAFALHEMFLGSSDGEHNIYDLTEGDDTANYDDGIVDNKPVFHSSTPISGTPMNGTMLLVPTTSQISQRTYGTQVGSAAGDLSRISPIFTDSVAPASNRGQETSQSNGLPSNPPNPINSSHPQPNLLPNPMNSSHTQPNLLPNSMNRNHPQPNLPANPSNRNQPQPNLPANPINRSQPQPNLHPNLPSNPINRSQPQPNLPSNPINRSQPQPNLPSNPINRSQPQPNLPSNPINRSQPQPNLHPNPPSNPIYRSQPQSNLPSFPINRSQSPQPNLLSNPVNRTQQPISMDIPTQQKGHPWPAGSVSVSPGNGYPSHIRNSSPYSIAMGNSSLQSNSRQQLNIPPSLSQRHPATQITGSTAPVHASHNYPHVTNPLNHERPSMVSSAPYLRSSRPQMQPIVSTNEHMGQTAQQMAMWSRHLQNHPFRPQTSGQASLSAPRNLGNNVRTTSVEHGPAASGGLVRSVTRMEDLMVGVPEQYQRPAGRMRGSLSGAQVDSGDLSQHIIRPTNMGSAGLSQNSTAPHLRALIANRRVMASPPGPATSTGL